MRQNTSAMRMLPITVTLFELLKESSINCNPLVSK